VEDNRGRSLSGRLRVLAGEDLTADLAKAGGLDDPVLVASMEGLGLKGG
jgi:hypothetical protein